MKFQKYKDKIEAIRIRDAEAVKNLLDSVTPILIQEPMLVNIEDGTNSVFVGDTHGDFKTVLSIIKYFFKHSPRYLIFLGDYVDRGFGDMQIKLVNALFQLKKDFPDSVYLLRGNHEWRYINAEYGFRHAVFDKLNPVIYEKYNELFSELPLVVRISKPKRILALHGGIPIKDDGTPHDLMEIARLPKDCFENDLARQILWNDPSERIKGCKMNMRGLGRIFGIEAFNRFMLHNELDYCIRSHEIEKNGFKYYFDNRLITIFSSKSYGKKIKASILLLNRLGKLEIKEIKLI
ncbi:MAG: metallophosphoesterase [Candidatus Helarchaeales archaeon]